MGPPPGIMHQGYGPTYTEVVRKVLTKVEKVLTVFSYGASIGNVCASIKGDLAADTCVGPSANLAA